MNERKIDSASCPFTQSMVIRCRSYQKNCDLVSFDFPSICSKAGWLLPRKIATIVVQGPLKDYSCRVSRLSGEYDKHMAQIDEPYRGLR